MKLLFFKAFHFLEVHSISSPEVLIHFHVGFGTNYSMGCILKNSVLWIICVCRHLANHLGPQNLIFFNNYHKPFPSRAMSSFILLYMRILIVLSIFSNTWTHAWPDTPLCSEPSLSTADGALIKHEGYRTHRP